MSSRSGKCLCGAVRFVAEDVDPAFGACHCSMCRAWASGTFLATHAEGLAFEGEDHIALYPSSAWAERAFCKTCGTNLFYRITAEGPHEGSIHISIGVLDDLEGMHLAREVFIDEKPACISLVGDTEKLTGAELFAMFAPPEGP